MINSRDGSMKIAFIVKTFPILSETFILNQITGLLDMGHDVEIFARTDPHEDKVHNDIDKYKLRKTAPVKGNSWQFR